MGDSFGDARVEFVGPLLQWRVTRDRGHVFADVATTHGPRAGEYVQLVNVLKAEEANEALAELFGTEQRSLRRLGRVISRYHALVERAFAPERRSRTFDRAAEAQEEYLRRTFG